MARGEKWLARPNPLQALDALRIHFDRSRASHSRLNGGNLRRNLGANSLRVSSIIPLSSESAIL
jgi:hypothetical protein